LFTFVKVSESFTLRFVWKNNSLKDSTKVNQTRLLPVMVSSKILNFNICLKNHSLRRLDLTRFWTPNCKITWHIYISVQQLKLSRCPAASECCTVGILIYDQPSVLLQNSSLHLLVAKLGCKKAAYSGPMSARSVTHPHVDNSQPMPWESWGDRELFYSYSTLRNACGNFG